MHKSNQNNALRERNGLRMLVAISLTTFLAGLGACTTNYTPGNGQPTTSGSYGTMPRAGSYGSSSGTEGSVPQSRMIVAPDVITPMYSSSSEAAGVLAGHQGRFLGYANPGPASPNYGNDIVTGQVIPPALTANPQSTVNSSISSPPTPVITSGVGAGDVGSGVVIGALSAAATTGTTASAAAAITAPLTATGTTTAATSPLVSAAPIFATPSTLVTPANAAIQTTSGAFAAGPGVAPSNANVATNRNTGLLTPTVTSSLTPSPTAASNPPVASVGTTTATTSNLVTTPATSTRTATGSISMPQRVSFPSTGVSASGGAAHTVRLTTSNGSVVITNQ